MTMNCLRPAFGRTGEFRCYPADSRAAAAARLHVRDQLRAWGLSAVADDVELCVSELVTNAITHGNGEHVALLVELTGQAVVAKVWDGSPDPPRARKAGPQDDSGRGLMLVDALSSRHGWYPTPGGGKVVWCAFDVAPVLPSSA